MRGKSDLLQRLQIEHPIFQAPMAGGGDTPNGRCGFQWWCARVYRCGVSHAGTNCGLWSCRSCANHEPFGINLFAPLPPADPSTDCAAALQRVAPYFAELGLPAPSLPTSKTLPFAEQLEAALQTDASVFSFTFGIPPADALEAIRRRQMILMGTATTVDEAVATRKGWIRRRGHAR